MNEDSARLFIGLELDDGTRSAIRQWADALSMRLGGRFYEAELYHVTLCFLGQTPRERIPTLLDSMRECAGDAFSLALDALGAFKQGSILYAGVKHCPALFDLQHRLAQTLREQGFALEDAPYVPHITLARHGTGYREPLPAPERRFDVRQLTLFESARLDGRLRYLPLHRVPLKTPGQATPL